MIFFMSFLFFVFKLVKVKHVKHSEYSIYSSQQGYNSKIATIQQTASFNAARRTTANLGGFKKKIWALFQKKLFLTKFVYFIMNFQSIEKYMLKIQYKIYNLLPFCHCLHSNHSSI